MNIVLFSDTFYPEVNGVATSVYSLFLLLNKKGHNCYVVTTTSEKHVIFKDNIIRIPGLTLKALYGYKAAFLYNRRVYKFLKKLNIDLIHVNTEYGIGIFARIVSKKLNIPLVYTYHTMYEDYTYYITKGHFDRGAKWLAREITRGNIFESVEVIAPSEKTKTYLRALGIEKYINVVPTGFDLNRFSYKDEYKEEIDFIKNKYNLNNKKILLCLGRLAHEKSFDVILKCYKEYISSYTEDKDSIILFVGDGPNKSELEELSKTLNIENRVLFIGKVDLEKVPLYYNLAHLFLNASISETQGLTFMEAMAAKLIILCRFDNNLINVIKDNETGFFFENEVDFKDKLHYILSLKEEELNKIKKTARESINIYSEDSFYDNIIKVYERAIRRNW